MEGEDGLQVVERAVLSDDSDEEGFQYTEVDAFGADSSGEDSDEDLAAALASLQQKREKGLAQSSSQKKLASASNGEDAQPQGRVVTQVRPSVMDDFIRNFLIKVGMPRSLDAFNTEWYELQAKGRLTEEHTSKVPDIYLRSQELAEQVASLRQQLGKMQRITERAQGTWDKFRKERDFHRLHHKRVVQEKGKLVVDLKRLSKHCKSYEPTLQELQRKHQVALKEKMLMKLERDRMKAKVATLEATVRSLEGDAKSRLERDPSALGTNVSSTLSPGKAGSTASQKHQHQEKIKAESRLPPNKAAANPFADLAFPPPAVERFSLKKSFKGHLNSVASIAFHPRKSIIATVSDDETWKVWSVPDCDLIMSGEGHRNWIAGADFHPHGTMLATASGDNTVKLWDFQKASCAATLTDHMQAVWDVAFHHTGDFVASCSMDHTSRLWDTNTQRCRQTFRGHVDSVNSVCWQPYSNSICTGSGDKTVSLWDARSGLCIQTFYGHMNAVNHTCTNLRGDTVASCDADGVVKLWDVRMVVEMGTMEAGQHPLNRVCFDRSGTRLAAASDDGTIKVFDTEAKSLSCELQGHEDAVQSVLFSPVDDFLVSSSSDCTFRIWS